MQSAGRSTWLEGSECYMFISVVERRVGLSRSRIMSTFDNSIAWTVLLGNQMNHHPVMPSSPCPSPGSAPAPNMPPGLLLACTPPPQLQDPQQGAGRSSATPPHHPTPPPRPPPSSSSCGGPPDQAAALANPPPPRPLHLQPVVMDIPPNQTIYINNLYEKLSKDGARSTAAARAARARCLSGGALVLRGPQPPA